MIVATAVTTGATALRWAVTGGAVGWVATLPRGVRGCRASAAPLLRLAAGRPRARGSRISAGAAGNCRDRWSSRGAENRWVDPLKVGESGSRPRRGGLGPLVEASGRGTKLGINEDAGPEGVEGGIDVNGEDVSGSRAAQRSAAAPDAGPVVQVTAVV